MAKSTREKASTKKTTKVKRTSLKTHKNAPLPKTPIPVNPTLKIVEYRQPKKPKGKKKVPVYRQPQ